MIIVIESNNEHFNGTICEYEDDAFIVITSESRKLTINKLYSRKELEDLFDKFTFKELLFG